MVEVISNLCRDRGHQAFPFSSSESALDALPRIDPQLVIVDVKMEKVGGFDILRDCRGRFPNTAVIMLTAYASVEAAGEAIKMGAYDYITRPFKVDEPHAVVQQALDYQSPLPQ